MYHVSFKKLPVSWILGYRRNLEVKNGAYYLKKSSNVHPVHHWTTSPTSPQLPPEIVMEKGCNFRTRPPGSTIWKGRLRYGRFFVSINCWSTSAATLFLEIQSYCWWKKEIRRSPVDDMENLPFTGFQKHLRWLAGFLNHQQDFGWNLGVPVFSNQKWWWDARVRCQSPMILKFCRLGRRPKTQLTCRWWLQMVSSMAMLQND